VNKEEFQSWELHPQTQQFFKFLMDYRQTLMEKWANGELVGENEIAFKARAQQAYEFANLADDAIQEFYKQQKGEVNADQD